ncbi:hypothetical protein [[Clostridium] aminophilum]|uniref:hypothetical protein n=1 Tax=[Clostridium] aminophilum TaxID=1526 RepID=UPI00333050EC
MKKYVAVVLSLAAVIGMMITGSSVASAAEKKEVLSGTIFDLDEDDKYVIDSSNKKVGDGSRLYLSGEITSGSTQNGFASYAVESGDIKIMVDPAYKSELASSENKNEWHIITDNSKTVDSTKLTDKVKSGAIIVQTSKDGNAWINAYSVTDFYKNLETINSQELNGEKQDAFYETTAVQLANGCYYRIIVAYELEREIDPSKILFWNTTNTEQKEVLEIYQFYAYDSSVDQTEKLNTMNAYEFSTVYRVDDQDGFENQVPIKSDDPHNDWSVGKFYISGYTDYRMDGDVPVFLKVPGDRAALWFNLEQKLDKCNGRTDVKVNYISSGSDIYFGTPTISNLGKGALIIRKTNKQNQKEREIYTNYLEASATVGANTRVDLFEEGDYEVALDYQLQYDKPFVFGTTTTKTLTYRVFFKFKVRNGDISAFLRDVDTDQFITNANIAEHGFFIDVANSQYLNMSIKRDVLSDSADGIVPDNKFTGVAIDGRKYTEEGIYTVTVENPATGDKTEKTVYVGNTDIMRAHMTTGLTIAEINEKLANGAYIDENGQLIGIESVKEEAVEVPIVEDEKQEAETNHINYLVIASIIIVAVIAFGGIVYKRKKKSIKIDDKEDEAK